MIKLFSAKIEIVDNLELKLKDHDVEVIYSLDKYDFNDNDNDIVIADYDSVSKEINTLLASAKVINNLIVLESLPALATGKFLIQHGIKAYGNINMNSVQLNNLVKVVSEDKVWIYPELTANLATLGLPVSLDNTLMSRLNLEEKEIVILAMNGNTNEAISNIQGITIRNVKQKFSSIFSKLHVNNRIGLILLLKS